MHRVVAALFLLCWSPPARAECPADAGAADCVSDPCQGISYNGCCSGATVYWCSEGALASIPCGSNETLTVCALSPTKKVTDCVEPGTSATAPLCPFPDAVSQDLPPVSDDVLIPLDSITVPDLHAPSQCAKLEARYAVAATDCPLLGTSFQVKQEGCVAVLAGLLPDSPHPAAKVTLSGLAFEYKNEGRTAYCTGTFQDEGIPSPPVEEGARSAGEEARAGTALQGTCTADEQTCSFTFTPIALPVAEEKKDRGCGVGGSPGSLAGGLLLVLLWLIRLTRRSTASRAWPLDAVPRQTTDDLVAFRLDRVIWRQS